jgi:hypothetical protein
MLDMVKARSEVFGLSATTGEISPRGSDEISFSGGHLERLEPTMCSALGMTTRSSIVMSSVVTREAICRSPESLFSVTVRRGWAYRR